MSRLALVRTIGFLIVIGLLAVAPLSAQEEPYFPGAEWRTSTPEAQGMDSEVLAQFVAMLPTLETVDSLIIIRNGYVVTEVYYHPFTRDMDHEWWSVSKSIASTLVGIAIDKGYIGSVDDTVLSYFPDYTVANLDANKQAMTIEDLLTMRSGFDCDVWYDDPSVELLEAEDAIQLALDWPMALDPGADWQFCPLNAYLLMAIVERATGMPALEFLAQNLFGPLGIDDYEWVTSRQGIPLGFTGLILHPRDLARLGYLYLMGGRWGDEQIVSASWIEKSTSGISQFTWERLARYGYQWWTFDKPVNVFTAIGEAGQFLAVIPDENLVFVLGSSTVDDVSEWQALHIRSLLTSLLPSLKSSESITANPEFYVALLGATALAENPVPAAPQALPEVAAAISGVTYELETQWNLTDPELPNTMRLLRMGTDWQVGALTFDFDADLPTLTMTMADSTQLAVPVGYDMIYRTIETEYGPVASRAEHKDYFVSISIRPMMNTSHVLLTCSLSDETTLRCTCDQSFAELNAIVAKEAAEH